MKTFDRKEIIKRIQAQIFKIDHKIFLLQTERRKLKINIDILNGEFTKANAATVGAEKNTKTTARAKESQ